MTESYIKDLVMSLLPYDIDGVGVVATDIDEDTVACREMEYAASWYDGKHACARYMLQSEKAKLENRQIENTSEYRVSMPMTAIDTMPGSANTSMLPRFMNLMSDDGLTDRL